MMSTSSRYPVPCMPQLLDACEASYHWAEHHASAVAELQSARRHLLCTQSSRLTQLLSGVHQAGSSPNPQPPSTSAAVQPFVNRQVTSNQHHPRSLLVTQQREFDSRRHLSISAFQPPVVEVSEQLQSLSFAGHQRRALHHQDPLQQVITSTGIAASSMALLFEGAAWR